MLDWLKINSKEYPDFWKEYLAKFDEKNAPRRYVVFCTDCTGFNPEMDVIFSIGAIGVLNESIYIGDSFEIILLQYKYLHDNNLSNEFLIESKQKKTVEPQAIKEFVEFIGSSALVGYRPHLELELINKALEKLNCGRLKNEALDIEIMYKKLMETTDKSYRLNTIYTEFKMPKDEGIQTASESSYKMALLFLKLKTKLGIK